MSDKIVEFPKQPDPKTRVPGKKFVETWMRTHGYGSKGVVGDIRPGGYDLNDPEDKKILEELQKEAAAKGGKFIASKNARATKLTP